MIFIASIPTIEVLLRLIIYLSVLEGSKESKLIKRHEKLLSNIHHRSRGRWLQIRSRFQDRVFKSQFANAIQRQTSAERYLWTMVKTLASIRELLHDESVHRFSCRFFIRFLCLFSYFLKFYNSFNLFQDNSFK